MFSTGNASRDMTALELCSVPARFMRNHNAKADPDFRSRMARCFLQPLPGKDNHPTHADPSSSLDFNILSNGSSHPDSSCGLDFNAFS
jgi:hypothetical protein